jgi:CheY-like chemotaxis protein
MGESEKPAPLKPGDKVMVVEDDPDLRGTIVDILADQGFSVVEAHNGRAALQTLDEGELPALILLDLMMPLCSGWEFLHARDKSLRLKNVPVVVMSALPPEAARIDADVLGHWHKPFDVSQLLTSVRRLTAA